MSETPAPAAPATPAAEPVATPAATTTTVDERLDAAISKVRDAAPVEPPAEPAPEVAPAEPPAEEPPSPPPPPPTLAEATRRLKAAKAKEDELKAERERFESETARVKGILERAWPEFELGRDLSALKGQPASKILARLRQSGIDLDARSLAAAVLEPEDDDRPLTMKQLRELQEKERQERAASEAKSKGETEAKAKATRDASEAAFVQLATPEKAPVSARVLARFGAHGRALLVDRAWQAQAQRTATGQPLSMALLLADVEAGLAKEFPEFAPPPAATAATTTPAAPSLSVVKPSAVSNGVASRTSGPRRLSEEERWAQFEQKQQRGARLNGHVRYQHHPRKCDR